MRDDKPIPRKYDPNNTPVTSDKRVKKVINGTAKVRKKSEARKLADSFVSSDASSVKSYIFSDVIIPAAKKLIYDIFTDGIDMILYGGRGGSDRRRPIADRVGFTRYDKCADKGRYSERRESRSRAVYDYDRIVVPTKGDAEAVLDQMDDLIERYEIASVADLYEAAGLTPSHTDFKYGWTDLSSADTIRTRDGEYTFKLPKPLPLD